ncbi:MAG: adenylyl-sulfate kinase [Pontimonas sp.]|nr:adenylyl-sulfate kinase [Pontimonas sp.]
MLRDVLRITTAGSVDDGKSTLIARLLLDTKSIPEDQISGVLGSSVDPTRIADLLDGLESEKEQGITIDVAHRFFDSQQRRYHLSDSPGHEQYTRNMATAAAGADVVILVIDASAGIKPQTTRHLSIAYQLGVRQFLVVANKCDLIQYSSKVLAALEKDINNLFSGYADTEWSFIPASGTEGAMVVTRGSRMRWYKGPTILEALDRISREAQREGPAAIAVQMVQRLGNRTRVYLASVLRGQVEDGMVLTISPGGTTGTLKNLTVNGRPSPSASVRSEIAFELAEERDVERGALLTHNSSISSSHQWDATLIWLGAEEGVIGRPYIAKLGYQTGRITVTRASELSPEENRRGEVRVLAPNGTYRATISGQQDFALAPFHEFPEAGRFILVSPEDGQTTAVGLVNFSLRRSDNIRPHTFGLDQEHREELAGGRGKVLWFTGLSGSGKSTIADQVSQQLTESGRIVAILDGDNLRTGLNSDLGFTEADRVENIRRTAEVAKLMAETGVIVAVSLISPYRQDRERAREIIGSDRFSEIHVATSLSICEGRDPKGLYKKARAGEIPNFTGINAPYEEPPHPDLVVDGAGKLKDQVRKVLSLVED